jgi:hypothetical protein
MPKNPTELLDGLRRLLDRLIDLTKYVLSGPHGPGKGPRIRK